MFNLRDKSQPNKVFRLVELKSTPIQVEYLGKFYILPQNPTLKCKGVGFSKSAILQVKETLINHKDNPGMTPIRGVNIYKFQIQNNKVVLNHCMILTSKTSEGGGFGEILGKTEVGAFNSVDILRDFCKRHNLSLIN